MDLADREAEASQSGHAGDPLVQCVSREVAIADDAALLEALQQGPAGDDVPSFHGSYETPLRSMARVYRSLIA
jgi:hypothetical protein